MTDKLSPPKPTRSADWFVQGILTKIGDTFDRLTGRGWKPSSSLATSELAERLKTLLDEQIKIDAEERKFVPHNIFLRMQWDKFSDDAETSLAKLENQLLTAAVDHINDRHYYTYAPLSLKVKPDYFTDGVKLNVNFDTFSETGTEGELNVVLPATSTGISPEPETETIEINTIASFSLEGQNIVKPLHFVSGKRLSVGRTKENDLMIDDPSISKFHASLVLGIDSRYTLADTGSTNGTFINGERISYGKSVRLRSSDVIRFGNVEVAIDLKAEPVARVLPEVIDDSKNEQFTTIGDFQFSSSKIDISDDRVEETGSEKI
jgi:pSer/pThr/pTyr-binding forkhead associated (FHA) protein